MELVADAGGVGGLVLDEEGAVGTQAGGALLQLGVVEMEREHVVEHLEGEGGVAAAATETGAEGDAFPQADGDRRDAELGVQEVVGFHAEVVLGAVVEDDAVLLHGGLMARFLNLEGVAQVHHGDEEGFEVVVTVGAFADDVQAEVNLAVWIRYHRRG